MPVSVGAYACLGLCKSAILNSAIEIEVEWFGAIMRMSRRSYFKSHDPFPNNYIPGSNKLCTSSMQDSCAASLSRMMCVCVEYCYS